MLITPQVLSRLDSMELRARQIVEGFITGMHKSPYYGFSVEFAEHRPYNTGDELRHIDWKVYAKRERYYVKQYEEETNLRSVILLDVSPSMWFKYFGDWSKLKYGAHFAAALMYMMNRQRDATGLITFDDQIRDWYPPKTSRRHIQLMYKQLEKYAAENREKSSEQRGTASADVLHEVAERIHKRSLVIIISDLFENTREQERLISALKHLRHKKHEVILFNVLEKRSEREFDFPDRKYTFSDLETGRSLELLPVRIRKEYRDRVAEWTKRFRIACHEAHIDFEEIDTEGAFDMALLAYLTKRRKIG